MEPDTPAVSVRKGHILIVDDAALNLKLLSDMLSEKEYRISTAPNAQEALDILESELPDLVILDVNLPGISGIELCRQIKSNDLWSSIPVLFLSALGSIEDKLAGFEAGGVDYITKPFQKEEVFARINAHITIRSLQKDLEDRLWELRVLYEQVKDLSIRDSLTGLYNRRYIDEVLLGQISRSTRYRHPLSIIIADLDFFKRINDRFGHQIGDEVLTKISQILISSVRDSDVVGRMGGEEFIILCPETTSEQALMVGERIRQKTEEYTWGEIVQDLAVTISVGISSTIIDVTKDVTALDRQKLMESADQNLYRAKEMGRNRVCTDQ